MSEWSFCSVCSGSLETRRTMTISFSPSVSRCRRTLPNPNGRWERADHIFSHMTVWILQDVWLTVRVFQRVINVTVAVNHMRRLQLAHADPPAPAPLIQVLDVSSPCPPPNDLDTNGNPSCSHMTLSPQADVSRGRGPLKACNSEPMHALVICETGEHVYRSESDLSCAANRCKPN